MKIYYRPNYPKNNDLMMNTNDTNCIGCKCRPGEYHLFSNLDLQENYILTSKQSLKYIIDHEIDKKDEKYQLLRDLYDSNDIDNYKIIFEIITNM